MKNCQKRIESKGREKGYVVNLHVLEGCNYKCKHCFAHFESGATLSVEQWKQAIDNITKKTFVSRFNLAGGEPLMYSGLDDLIEYINAKGIDVSIITNGFYLTEERIKRFKGKVSMIGISVDSLRPEVLRRMGRCTKDNEIIDMSRYVELCRLVKENGIKMKIDTVVSAENLHEDFKGFIQEVYPDRWKVLKMKRFVYNGFDNTDMEITNEEFKLFCFRHRDVPHIAEVSMRKSYIIIDPAGRLIDNSNDANNPIADLLHDDFSQSFASMPFDGELYEERYKDNLKVHFPVPGCAFQKGTNEKITILVENKRKRAAS